MDVGDPNGKRVCTLPSSAFVSLSAAVSWIAFGFIVDRDTLFDALQSDIIDGRPGVAIRLAEAVARLTVEATGGAIAMRGKYMPSDAVDEDLVLTETIDPIRLTDFAEFNLLHDGLRYGKGVTTIDGLTAVRLLFASGRRDEFRSVFVSRHDLSQCFPAKQNGLSLLGATKVVSKMAAESECEEWLKEQFASDPTRSRPKPSFRSEAGTRFGGRLSHRGFDRAWAKVAPQARRSTPGAKSKR